MKLIDKLKNVFFEEVPDDEDEEELPQTFAKKVEIPKKPIEIKREAKTPIIKPIVTLERETSKEEEKDEEIPVPEVSKEEIKLEETQEQTFPMMFDESDFLEDKKMKEMDDSLSRTAPIKKVTNEDKELYQGKRELSYVESVRKPNYTYTKSYYEEKKTKEFRPSPIISPVYGILDKNYRKEEVVTKKETRITSGRTNFDLDTVRNKAFGADDEEISDKKTREAKAKEETKEEKRIYDVNNNKPQVNKVTLADADEYYNDLGLAYNVDYSDASRTTGTRTSKYNDKEKKRIKDVDDNLFDLIDSMYNKED